MTRRSAKVKREHSAQPARVFVYEHLTGGGLLAAPLPHALRQSLAREGSAMAAALTADFAAVARTRVDALWDASSPVAWRADVRVCSIRSADEAADRFDRLAAESDWTVVIAPETDGVLAERCRRVLAAGGRLLGPMPCVVDLASDKHLTAEHLAAHGVPAPRGVALASVDAWPSDLEYPLVAKPRDGAGSSGVRIVSERPSRGDLAPCRAGYRVERYCTGMPASVAFLCGPRGALALAPCRQRLSDDGRFSYLGGGLPLPPMLAERAKRLAERAVASLGELTGYVGVDVVLGAAPAGDVVIEINPRLTTSYVGLRRACRENLAAAMLAAARGEEVDLPFDAAPIEFAADGTVRRIHSIDAAR